MRKNQTPTSLRLSRRLLQRRHLLVLLLLGCGVGLCLRAVHWPARAAATLTVTTTADSGAGSLRQAIADAASSGDTIEFSLSGCPCTITLTSGELVIGKSLTIRGLGANQLTVSGNNASRVFFIGSGHTVLLDALTVTGGNGVGAIFSSRGGGIYNSGTLTVTNSIVSGNSASGTGGGINNVGTLTLTNSTVSGNSASEGGGIGNNFGTLTVTNSTVSGNSASFNGGGIYNGVTLTLTNSTVSGNSASFNGGGIFNSGTVTLTNSTVSSNSANFFAGGIFSNPGTTLTLTNSTVTGNRADFDGNGTGTGGGIASDGTETLNNTIVAGNFRGTGTASDDISFPTGSGTINTANNNLIGDAGTAGGIANGTNGNIVGVAVSTVLNTTLAFNGGPTRTHALVPGSPALGAGSNAHLPADTFDLDGDGNTAEPLPVDQRGPGFPRVANTTVDIGAFEGAARVVTKTADTADGTCDGDCSLREAIAASSPGDTILFSSLFNTPQTITLGSGHLFINKDLKILGTGADKLTVSGNNASLVFFIGSIGSGHMVLLDALTVTGGFNTIGGGIHNFFGTLTLTNSTVSGNSAGVLGGGIYNNTGALRVINSTVSGNSSGFHGSGIYNDNGGTLTLTNSTVSGNSAGRTGGGIANEGGGMLTLTNSTVSGNSAGEFAGGIFLGDGTLTVTNSTVSGNRADSDGNGTGTGGGIAAASTETLNNTIVAGNFRGTGSTPDDISGSINTANNNLIGDAATSGGITDGMNGNIVGNNGSGTININTVLNTTLANNGGPTKTHALICDSPAIDAGSNTFAAGLTTDQRGTGFPRVFNATVDIGSFEFQQICNTQPTITAEPVSRQQGGPSANSQIATVSDAEDDEDSLTVEVNGEAAATVNGVTVSNLAVNASGNVTADVVADCSASNASFTLRVTDSGGLSAEDTLNVTVTANTAPTLTYNNASVLQGDSTTVNPATGPIDNGSIETIVVQSTGTYTGTISVDNSTGVVSISNAAPIGSHTITIRATDNCGLFTDAQFTLVVNPSTPADLDVEKSDASDPVLSGNNITYKIEVENDGPGTATGVVVTDTLPAGVTFVQALSSPGCIETSSQTVTCTIGNLGEDRGARRTIVGRPSGTGRFTNTVSVTADQPDPKLSNNTDTESTTVAVGVASLTLSPTSVRGGSSVTVTGTVTLSSAAPSGGVVVTLSSSNTSVARPAESSITIPEGSTSGTFTVRHFRVSSTKTVKIRARANGFSKEATLTVTR